MVQIIEQALPYGKLAENFGMSLGESIGEETSRQMTARGVQSIVGQLQQAKGPVSQLDLLTAIMRVPGMTQQNAQVYLPAIQDALSQRAARSYYEGGAGEQRPLPAGSEIQNISVADRATPQGGEAQVVDDTTLLTPAQNRALQRTVPIASPEDIRRRAVELQTQKPGLYANFQGYMDEAERDVNTQNQRLQAEQSQAIANQQLENTARENFNQTFQKRIQALSLQDAWQALPANVQKSLEDDVIRQMNSGKSQQRAVEEVSKRALEDVRKVADFKKLLGRPIFGAGDESLEKLLPYRDVYEKLGVLPEYKAELEKKGFGEYKAASAAYPASTANRKALAKLQPEAKKQTVWRKLVPPSIPFIVGAKLTESVIQDLQNSPERVQKTRSWAEKNINSLSPNESLQTLALAVSDAGYDDQAFYDVIQDKVDNGYLTLSPHQEQELARRAPVVPTLLDIFDASLQNFGKNTGKYGFWEQVTRRFGGKR